MQANWPDFNSAEAHCETLTEKNGAQGRNRTSDTRIFSPLLYRLSYLGTGRAAPTEVCTKGDDS